VTGRYGGRGGVEHGGGHNSECVGAKGAQVDIRGRKGWSGEDHM